VKVDTVLTPTGAAPALGPAGLQDASQLQAARPAAQVDILLDVQALQVGLRANAAWALGFDTQGKLLS
jgi:hypothetical protein